MARTIAVGFDMDGVVCRTHEEILRVGQELGKIDRRHTLAEVLHFEIERNFPGEITTAEMDRLLRETDVHAHPAPVWPLIQAFRDCREAGYEIHIVTARPGDVPQIDRETRDWLRTYQLEPHELRYVGAQSKASYAKEKGLDFFIEDKLATANALVEVCQPFLVWRNWNRPGLGMPIDPRIRHRPEPYFGYQFAFTLERLYRDRKRYLEGEVDPSTDGPGAGVR